MGIDPNRLTDNGRNSARPTRFEDESTEIIFTVTPSLQDMKDQGGWRHGDRTGAGEAAPINTIGTRGQDRDTPDEKE